MSLLRSAWARKPPLWAAPTQLRLAESYEKVKKPMCSSDQTPSQSNRHATCSTDGPRGSPTDTLWRSVIDQSVIAMGVLRFHIVGSSSEFTDLEFLRSGLPFLRQLCIARRKERQHRPHRGAAAMYMYHRLLMSAAESSKGAVFSAMDPVCCYCDTQLARPSAK